MQIIVLAIVLVLAFLGLKTAHMYIYGRWTPQYVGVSRRVILPRIGVRGRQWWANRFHSKVLTPEQVRSLITINCRIQRDLEQVIPYPMARRLVLDGPPDVTLYDCACRRSRENHCQPTQVCMAIGQPFAGFVLKQHPDRSRRISQEEALEILHAAHARGNVHTAWFKDLFQGRMYAICNCCKCCHLRSLRHLRERLPLWSDWRQRVGGGGLGEMHGLRGMCRSMSQRGVVLGT
jgi:hypothetical protein